MNFNNYTIKSQEVLQKASEIAVGNQQQVIETGHLIKVMLQSDENLVSFLAKKTGVSMPSMIPEVD